MDHNEMKHKLIEDYKDEVEGVHKYAKMSDEAERIGETFMAKTLCQLAHDEHRHAYMLRERLIKDFGYDPKSDSVTEGKWKAIREL